MKRLIGSLQIMVLLVYIVACNNTISTVIPTPTIPSTSTIIPTATETSTPFPTNTPLPTATPFCPPHPDSQATLSSVQEKTVALVPGAKVIWYDNFNCQDLSYGWVTGTDNPTTKISISNGILTFSAQKVEKIWDGLVRTSSSLGDQKGFLVLFRYQTKTTANLFFNTGTWLTSDLRSYGLGTGRWRANRFVDGIWEVWHGDNWLPFYFSHQVLKPNMWFYLLERLDKSGQATMRVWEKDDPTNYIEFNKVMPSNGIGRQWRFIVQVYEGTLEMDEYQELSFFDTQ